MVSSSLENLKKRKGTGGKIRPYRSRRLFERDYYSADTRLGEKTVQSRRTRGGKIKKFVEILSEIKSCLLLKKDGELHLKILLT